MHPALYYSLLLIAGFASGFIDSIAGGGGLISLPALLFLFAGQNPLHATSTNKLAATFGSFTSASRYLASKNVEPIAWPMAAIAFVGSAAGASLAFLLKPGQLNLLITTALIAVGCFVAFRKDFGQLRRHGTPHALQYLAALAFGLVIGFYDGLIGPGTGTFLAFVFILVLGMDFLNATGSTKLVNFATNVAALLTYLLRGVPIHYVEGCVMGSAILAGAYMGSGMAVRIGPKFIRPLFVAVAIVMAAKLAFDLVHAH